MQYSKRDKERQKVREKSREGERERKRRTFHRVDSRDDSPGLVKPSGNADIEFMVTMETGPEGTTFVRFIPYSCGYIYVINAVPMSSLTLLLACAHFTLAWWTSKIDRDNNIKLVFPVVTRYSAITKL